MNTSKQKLVSEIEAEIKAFDEGGEIPSRVEKVERLPDGSVNLVPVDREIVLAVAALKKCRKSLGFSQAAFAELLGVGYSTYTKYEQHCGSIPLPVQKLARLYAHLPELRKVGV